MKLEACDQHDQHCDRAERQEQQLGVRTHAAWPTRSATMMSGVSRISHTHACSSGDGSSRIASWLSSSDGA